MRNLPRASLLDHLNRAEKKVTTNKYCARADLQNESSVEQFFVSRCLKDLGYTDREIKPKTSLKEIAVARGTRREPFKPDYVIVYRRKPRWLIDAKSPTEDVDKWSYQGAGYALGLNQEYSAENPCDFYAITNGLAFKVYKWDESPPILSLTFSDFEDDNRSEERRVGKECRL